MMDVARFRRRQSPVGIVQSRTAQAFTLLYFAVALSYLWWRSSETVNWDAAYISVPFLLADWLGLGFFALFAMTLWARAQRRAPSARPGASVDVFIPTYNESVSVLYPTIAAALQMDYPHTTYVLDDGRREEVRELSELLGATYLTRPDNRGAKAGNINAALEQTDGDFIAIFDADHVPLPNFLTELLGYFEDPSVGLVQAPQTYYNLDSFQHGRAEAPAGNSPWHEQSIFYDVIMPGKDRWNSAFWCGSSAIVRRKALESTGGVDTRTITEDLHTSMRLQAAGWKTVYHEAELAVGIAADDAKAFLVQRSRWAQGAVQILRCDNPLVKQGLTWRQRLSYFSSLAYVFEYVPRTVYLVTPVLALFIGALPMTEMGWNLLYRFLPYWALGILASHLLTRGRNPYIAAERFHMLKLPVMLRAASTLVWPRKLSFQVTPKSGGVDRRFEGLLLVRWQIAAGVASLAAVVWAAVSYGLGASWALTGLSLLITAVWALFNAFIVASLAASILRRRHRRHVYRFRVSLPAVVSAGKLSTPVQLADLSSLGAGWRSPEPLPVGSAARLSFRNSEHSSISAGLQVTACYALPGGGYRLGGEFEEIDDGTRSALVLFLYQRVAPSSLGRTPPPPSLPQAPVEVELAV